jgi:hypothetical protein
VREMRGRGTSLPPDAGGTIAGAWLSAGGGGACRGGWGRISVNQCRFSGTDCSRQTAATRVERNRASGAQPCERAAMRARAQERSIGSADGTAQAARGQERSVGARADWDSR